MPNKVSRLGPEDLFDLRYLRDARLSPDGQRVAYAVSRTDREERFEISIANSGGGGEQRLSYPGNAMAPRWSPDGCFIAFVGDGRLRVAGLPSLSVSEPLTPDHLSVQGTPSWSPDGARIVVSLLERRIAEGPRRIMSKHFRAEGLGFIDALSQHIYEIDPSSGALRCLTPAQSICSQPEWSPCGRRILFLATDAEIPFASYSPRLLTVGADDGEITEVLGSRWYIASARWLPGGEHIAVAAARDSTLTISTLSLWVVDRFGTDAQLRTPGMVGSIGFWNHHDMPVWDCMYGTNALSILDRQMAFASVQKGGCVEIWRISLEGDVAVDR